MTSFLVGSMLIVTIADAPNWKLRPYVALTMLSIGLSVLETSQPKVARGLATMILAGLLIQRGEQLGRRIGQLVGDPT